MQIELKLNKDFERCLNALNEEYGEDFLELNGISEKKISPTDFLDAFVKSSNVADSSIDSNANITQKDIVTLRSEKGKAQEKLLSYFKIFLEYKQKYGLKRAKKWLELEWNKALYLHDANTANLVPYCFAYDLTKMVKEGLYWLPEHTKDEPAKHLETFIDFVKEFISYTSNRTSGACGLPNLIPYMYWYWKNDCKNGIHGLKVNDPEKFAKSQIQRFIFAINQPYTRDGVQSAFINTSVFDSEYFDALFGGMEFPDGTFAIDDKKEIMQFQKWFLEEMSKIKDDGKIFTFPVNTISLLYKNGKFVDEDFAKWSCEHNRKWNDSNIFCDSSVNSLSNCCRLKSSIKDLGYFNSIGSSGLRVGSVKVSTINLARIAIESKGNEDKFIAILKERLQYNMEALDVVRDIIKKNVKRGLLPNFNDGMLDFNHLYNTNGINGIYEVMRFFGYIIIDDFGNTKYKPEAFKFGKEILNTFKVCSSEFASDKDYKINQEQVPGESAADKFMKADRLLFGKTKCKVSYENGTIKDEPLDILPLRGNQWIPLGIKATLKDRIDICSKFDKYCDGGSIMHINVDAPFSTSEQAWDMLNYVANKGVTYFAFNGKYSTDDNGHLFYGDVCPECGSKKTNEYTRVVGFITKVASWSEPRREESKMREWMKLNEKGENA